MTTRLRLPALLVAAAIGAAACTAGGGEQITLSAVFDDVADLVPAAHVRAGDVPIGTVEDIELTDGLQARVTMQIRPDTGLPAETQAVLSKTSMLGERFIDLRPIGESGSIDDLDGQVLEDTRIVTDLEDLVTSGNSVLAFVAADQVAATVQAGAEAFAGRADLLGAFVEDVNAFVGRYRGGQDDLTRLIDSLDDLTAGLATNAEDNAAALADLRRFSEALQEEDDRLLDALDDVTRLSRVGDRIMEQHRTEMDNFVRRLGVIVGSLTEIDGALQGVLTWFPRHNRHVPNGAVEEHAQVWLDFILCGENDDQGDPSEDCTPPNPGEHAEQPPYHPNDEACMEDPDNCPKPEEGDGGGVGDIP